MVVVVCVYNSNKNTPTADFLGQISGLWRVKVASCRLRGDPTRYFPIPSSFFEFTHLVFRLCPRTPIPNQGPAVPPATPTAQLASIVCN